MAVVFRTVMKRNNLSPGDFPEITDFQMKLADQDFTKFHHLKQKQIDDAETVLSQDFPRLLEALPRIERAAAAAVAGGAYGAPEPPPPPVPPYARGGHAVEPDWNNGEDDNPFGSDDVWGLQEYVSRYQPAFMSASKDGYVSGAAAKSVFTSSGVSVANLRKIWDLSDIDKDGKLDFSEFVVAMYLVDCVKGGQPVPPQLESDLIPPEKRR